MAMTNEAVQGRVFCQIVGREISDSSCDSTQGQEGCLGCGAFTRRCEKCAENPVAVPIVGLCLECLAIERTILLEAKPDIPTRVKCQMMKRPISSAMCGSMQGADECSGCTAPTRMCTDCKSRPPYSAKFGLCLECTLKDFAPSLLGDGASQYEAPVKAPQLQQRAPEMQKLPVDIEGIMTKYAYVSVYLLTTKCRMSIELAEKKLSDLVNAGRLKKKSGDLYIRVIGGEVIPLETPYIPQGIRGKDTRKVLLEKSRSLISEERRASINLLVKRLDMTTAVAKSLLEVLVHEGLIEARDEDNKRFYVYVEKGKPPIHTRTKQGDETPEPESPSTRRLRFAEELTKLTALLDDKSPHRVLFEEIKKELELLDRLDTAIRDVLGEE